MIAGFVFALVAVAQAGQSEQITFTKDVASTLQQHCQVCHRPGAIAPMSLLTYEDVRPWAVQLKTEAEI